MTHWTNCLQKFAEYMLVCTDACVSMSLKFCPLPALETETSGCLAPTRKHHLVSQLTITPDGLMFWEAQCHVKMTARHAAGTLLM